MSKLGTCFLCPAPASIQLGDLVLCEACTEAVLEPEPGICVVCGEALAEVRLEAGETTCAECTVIVFVTYERGPPDASFAGGIGIRW